MIPNVGDRVKMTGIMPNDPYPMEVGAEGTVERIGEKIGSGDNRATQIMVRWDNGRELILLDIDPFVVTERAES